MKAYEGNDPFLFVSYAHGDAELVYAVLEALDNTGVRYWYDQGIKSGEGWKEKIEQRMADSVGALLFISESFVESPDCRKEVSLASALDKRFFLVRLDKAPLAHGLAYDLSGIHYLLYQDSAEALATSLAGSEGITPCVAKMPTSYCFWRPEKGWFGRFLTDEQQALRDAEEAKHFAAWGPERTLYQGDMRPDTWTVNSCIDSKKYGDERYFLKIREVGASQWCRCAYLKPGKRYEVQVIYDVNGDESNNKSKKGWAQRLKTSVYVPECVIPQRPGYVRAAFHASWTEESGLAPDDEIWSTIELYAEENPVFLEFVLASGRFHNQGKLDGSIMPTLIFDERGTYLGVNKISGIVPCGEDFAGSITFELEVHSHVGDLTVERLASVGGQEMKRSVLNARPGDIVTFQTKIKNVSDMDLLQVTFKDQVPEPLRLVEGTTVLSTSVNTGYPLSDSITSNGINTGLFGPGVSGIVEYKVEIPNHELPANYYTASLGYHSGGEKSSSLILHVEGTRGDDPRFVEDLRNDPRFIEAVKDAHLASWEPPRETFTMKRPAKYVTFNSITDNNIFRDERDFVRICRVGGDGKYVNTIQLVPGYVYEVYVFFHNSASPSMGEKGVARDVRMRVAFPSGLDAFEASTFRASVMCPNATPPEVWDRCVVWATEPVRVHYVEGSAMLSDFARSRRLPLGREILTRGGALLGSDWLDGVITGENGHDGGHVTLRFAVLEA